MVDLLYSMVPVDKYDLVFTSMVLHHVTNIDIILKKFKFIMNTSGYLCIADLSTEDGRFHSHMPHFVGHSGFDKEELTKQLNANNFSVEQFKTVLNIDRTFPDGTAMSYPVFLLVARKIK